MSIPLKRAAPEEASSELGRVDSPASSKRMCLSPSPATFPADNPFDRLPIEINQMIACHLENDNDVRNFRYVSAATRQALNEQSMHFWHQRFLNSFDEPATRYSKNLRYRREQTRRRSILNFGANMSRGKTGQEIECLQLLRDFIIESFGTIKSNKSAVSDSLNIEHMKRFALAGNFQRFVCGKVWATRLPPIDSGLWLLQTIQVVMTPHWLSLSPEALSWNDRFHVDYPASQLMAYSVPTNPSIMNGNFKWVVDVDWMMHQVIFWRYHLCRESEYTLYQAFSALPEADRPRWWASKLSQSRDSRPFGRRWKYIYSYLPHSELIDFRYSYDPDDEYEQETYSDAFPGESESIQFQDLELNMLNNQQMYWPAYFQKLFNAAGEPKYSKARTRAEHKEPFFEEGDPDSIPQAFHATGIAPHVDGDEMVADGWLQPLPPQQGIPGWQRLTMMKYKGSPRNAHDLWAYEGIVLPGGQIVIGRWFDPSGEFNADMYSGPFMMWCVD